MVGDVATAGDVNGDGYADVIMGADRYAKDSSGKGRFTSISARRLGQALHQLDRQSDQEEPGWAIRRHRRGRQRRWLCRSDRRLPDDPQPSYEGAALCLPGNCSRAGSAPTWVAKGDQVYGAVGVLSARPATSTATATPTSSSLLQVQQWPDQEGRAYLSWLGVRPVTASAWISERQPDLALFGYPGLATPATSTVMAMPIRDRGAVVRRRPNR